MNDGPSSVRVPRLNLIRALNLPGREHDGIPCGVPARATETTGGCRGNGDEGVGRRTGAVKAPDGATTGCVYAFTGGARLFALRTTEQIRHDDDDAVDSGRPDCHANRATERRRVIDSRRSAASDSRSEIRRAEREAPAGWRTAARVQANYTGLRVGN